MEEFLDNRRLPAVSAADTLPAQGKPAQGLPAIKNELKAIIIIQNHLESVFMFSDEIHSLPDPEDALERSVLRLSGEIAPFLSENACSPVTIEEAKNLLGFLQETGCLKSLAAIGRIVLTEILAKDADPEQRKASLVRAIGCASEATGSTDFLFRLLTQNNTDSVEKALVQVFGALGKAHKDDNAVSLEERSIDPIRRICLRNHNTDLVNDGIRALADMGSEAVPASLNILKTKKEMAVNHRNNQLEAAYRDMLSRSTEVLASVKGPHAEATFRFFCR